MNIEPSARARSSGEVDVPRGQGETVGLAVARPRQRGDVFKKGERRATALIGAATSEIETAKAGEIEYVALVDPDSMRAIDTAGDRALMAMAVRVGKTRLIDNRLLER